MSELDADAIEMVSVEVLVKGVPGCAHHSETLWSVDDVPPGQTHHRMVADVLRHVAARIEAEDAPGHRLPGRR